jgi:hypothetical protein
MIVAQSERNLFRLAQASSVGGGLGGRECWCSDDDFAEAESAAAEAGAGDGETVVM